MRRSLKSQIRMDAKRVFLDLDDFATLEHILYWRHGRSKEPEDRRIPVVINRDTNMNSVWNKNKNQQRIGSDQTLFQMELILFCALEDFNPPPKKGNMIQVGDHRYDVLSVTTEGGILKVELRELEE